MNIASLGEFGLISNIKSRFTVPDGVTGIGDDCAIIPQKDGRQTLVSSDILMEGVHFLRKDASAFDIGWKSAAVNISDIAAMGGEPEATFLSFSLPSELESSWVESFMDGYARLSAFHNVPLLGGDTTSSPDRICICVTVIGHIKDGCAKLRSAARPGDAICVTGSLGSSACGLKVILDNIARGEDETYLVERHYRPRPRVREGLLLGASSAVHAMMDISDGIGSDLRHILSASGVGAVIDGTSLPLEPQMLRVCSRNGWDPYHLAINGGEDYELLFTADREALGTLDVGYYIIGEITASRGIRAKGLSFEGFRHF